MNIEKPDEMERFQNGKAALFTFAFYGLALLAWSFYEFFTKGDLGWQFIILLMGNVIFFGSRLIYNRKMS